jgi:hypothetical protein
MKSTSLTTLCWLFALALLGCGGERAVTSDGEGPGVPDGGPRDHDLIPDGGPTDHDPIPDWEPSVCFVDFPCGPDETIHCVGAATYQKVETIGCEELCPPGPCSGAACINVGPVQTCPAGQVCIQTGYGWEANDHCGTPDAGPPVLDAGP